MEDRIIRTADMSISRRYRYGLRREWEDGALRCVCFIMLNPSTADGTEDDPTIRRCMAFARRWGYKILEVRNLFALRATDPSKLMEEDDPVGPRNDTALLRATKADLIIAAWGSKVPYQMDKEVVRKLGIRRWFCLGKTKDGNPRHPLYVPANKQIEPFP